MIGSINMIILWLKQGLLNRHPVSKDRKGSKLSEAEHCVPTSLANKSSETKRLVQEEKVETGQVCS